MSDDKIVFIKNNLSIRGINDSHDILVYQNRHYWFKESNPKSNTTRYVCIEVPTIPICSDVTGIQQETNSKVTDSEATSNTKKRRLSSCEQVQQNKIHKLSFSSN